MVGNILVVEASFEPVAVEAGEAHAAVVDLDA
jgi:hypothetical protein